MLAVDISTKTRLFFVSILSIIFLFMNVKIIKIVVNIVVKSSSHDVSKLVRTNSFSTVKRLSRCPAGDHSCQPHPHSEEDSCILALKFESVRDDPHKLRKNKKHHDFAFQKLVTIANGLFYTFIFIFLQVKESN